MSNTHELILDCPSCGGPTEHGNANGQHIIFCNDHLSIQATGSTRAEAEVAFSQKYWDFLKEDDSNNDDGWAFGSE